MSAHVVPMLQIFSFLKASSFRLASSFFFLAASSLRFLGHARLRYTSTDALAFDFVEDITLPALAKAWSSAALSW